MAAVWIQYVGGMPPTWMLHDPALVINYTGTLAMNWIDVHKSEPPVCLRHAPDIHSDEYTVAMTWIMHFGTEPPEWMRHRSDLAVSCQTMAGIWIQRVKTLPPEWMMHDPAINAATRLGTLAMAWFITVNERVPTVLFHNPSIKGAYIMNTAAMLWVYYIKSNPPSWTWHDPRLDLGGGVTIMDRWKIDCPNQPIPAWMYTDVADKNRIAGFMADMKISCSHVDNLRIK
jgi:hypothetical protein